MKKVYIELTSKCNLECNMCYRKAWHRDGSHMDHNGVLEMIKAIKNHKGIHEVVFGGIGEPTYSPYFTEALDAFKNYHVTVTSNGVQWTDELIQKMVSHANKIIVSIDGLSGLFEQIRGVPLENVTKNLDALNSEKNRQGKKTPEINFQMVLSKMNLEDAKPIIDLAKSMNVQQIIYSNMLPVSAGDLQDILYTRYENNHMKKFFEELNKHALKRGVRIKLPQYQLKTERKCTFITQNSGIITEKGDVVPCYRMAHDGCEYVFGRYKDLKAHRFGNIHDCSIEEIWSSQAYRNFRDVVTFVKYPSCIDCDLADGCDLVRSSDCDCYGNTPTCGDCLWAREIVVCG